MYHTSIVVIYTTTHSIVYEYRWKAPKCDQKKSLRWARPVSVMLSSSSDRSNGQTHGRSAPQKIFGSCAVVSFIHLHPLLRGPSSRVSASVVRGIVGRPPSCFVRPESVASKAKPTSTKQQRSLKQDRTLIFAEIGNFVPTTKKESRFGTLTRSTKTNNTNNHNGILF